jgi:nitroimidazol reductase NimA-like FMN-containing flavoprotein (pyridoxamine 5'-phosphate oxidase superfamily)
MRVEAVDQRSELSSIARDECVVLLRWEIVGRLAVAAPGQAPLVVPVNFVLSGDRPVFRTDDGEKLERLKEQPVSFQVDRFDWFRRIGWSVLVQGSAAEISAADAEALGIEPWAPGAKDHYVQIIPTSITGRRIELRQAPLDGRAYL